MILTCQKLPSRNPREAVATVQKRGSASPTEAQIHNQQLEALSLAPNSRKSQALNPQRTNSPFQNGTSFSRTVSPAGRRSMRSSKSCTEDLGMCHCLLGTWDFVYMGTRACQWGLVFNIRPLHEPPPEMFTPAWVHVKLGELPKMASVFRFGFPSSQAKEVPSKMHGPSLGDFKLASGPELAPEFRPRPRCSLIDLAGPDRVPYIESKSTKNLPQSAMILCGFIGLLIYSPPNIAVASKFPGRPCFRVSFTNLEASIAFQSCTSNLWEPFHVSIIYIYIYIYLDMFGSCIGICSCS